MVTVERNCITPPLWVCGRTQWDTKPESNLGEKILTDCMTGQSCVNRMSTLTGRDLEPNLSRSHQWPGRMAQVCLIMRILSYIIETDNCLLDSSQGHVPFPPPAGRGGRYHWGAVYQGVCRAVMPQRVGPFVDFRDPTFKVPTYPGGGGGGGTGNKQTLFNLLYGKCFLSLYDGYKHSCVSKEIRGWNCWPTKFTSLSFIHAAYWRLQIVVPYTSHYDQGHVFHMYWSPWAGLCLLCTQSPWAGPCQHQNGVCTFKRCMFALPDRSHCTHSFCKAPWRHVEWLVGHKWLPLLSAHTLTLNVCNQHTGYFTVVTHT